MPWWICADKTLRNAASPGPGDPSYNAEIVANMEGITSGVHHSEINGYCTPSGSAPAPTPVSGTGYNDHAGTMEKEPLNADGTGVKISTSFYHPEGPFGMESVPTRYGHYTRPYGGVPEYVGFYGLPWVTNQKYQSTILPFMMAVKIKSERSFDLSDPNDATKSMYFSFDISTALDFTNHDNPGQPLASNKTLALGYAFNALRYVFPDNDTPYMPNTGFVNPTYSTSVVISAERKVMSPHLDIILFVWLPMNVYDDSYELVDTNLISSSYSRLTVSLRNVKILYRQDRTS